MSDLLSDEKEAIEQRRWIAAWESQPAETSPDIERRKLAGACLAQATNGCRDVSSCFQADTAGLRNRYPDADEHKLRFRFASLLFDRETARQLCKVEPEGKTDDAS
jgi:hypothetical protein